MPAASSGDAGSPIRAEELRVLLAHGLTPGTLEAAQREADRLGIGVDAVLLAEGAVSADEFYRALATACGVPFLPEPRVVLPAAPSTVLRSGLAPLRPGQPARWITAPTGAQLRPLLAMADTGRSPSGLALTSPHRFERAVLDAGGRAVATAAATALPRRMPQRSIRGGLRRPETWLMLALVGLASFWITHAGRSGLPDAALAVCLVVMPGLALRLGAVVESRPRGPLRPRAPADVRLPGYSILVALYKEAGVVPQLCAALDRIDYPRPLLEVLFLVEADDAATREALEEHLRPQTQRIVICPPGLPRTKPRALNVGLALARGELVVVYDAEDEPAADQLRLAAARFAAAGPDLACVQAVLTIHNDADGWLARLMRLEYAALFGVVLQGLANMQLPFPLGGTSNHFRRAALLAVGGWDAWNVTEDADLGLRLSSLGYRLDVMPSETAEEAPATLRVWFAQRRRWLKGWMQTSIVASRPGGARGAMGRLAVFAHGWSTVTTALAAPLAMVFLALGIAAEPPSLKAQGAAALGLVVFFAGVLALWWPVVVGAARLRIALEWRDFALLGPSMLLVWAAAWAALLELVVAPQRWNKTPHGETKAAPGHPASPKSEHRLEFARGLGRAALEVESADKAAALVHQVDEGGVVHRVPAALGRHLAGIDAPRLEHRIQRGAVAAQPADPAVEARQVRLEDFRRVALRIDGDEEAAQPVALRA